MNCKHISYQLHVSAWFTETAHSNRFILKCLRIVRKSFAVILVLTVIAWTMFCFLEWAAANVIWLVPKWFGLYLMRSGSNATLNINTAKTFEYLFWWTPRWWRSPSCSIRNIIFSYNHWFDWLYLSLFRDSSSISFMYPLSSLNDPPPMCSPKHPWNNSLDVSNVQDWRVALDHPQRCGFWTRSIYLGLTKSLLIQVKNLSWINYSSFEVIK